MRAPVAADQNLVRGATLFDTDPTATNGERTMDLRSLVLFLVVGITAGLLAGRLMKSGSSGVVGNLIIGAIGAFVGGWLFKLVGVSAGTGIVGSLVTALVGAIVLIYVLRLLKKA